MGAALAALALEMTPSVIKMLQDRFAADNPGQPVPTSAEVIAAWQDAFTKSLAIDDEYLATHPAEPNEPTSDQ